MIDNPGKLIDYTKYLSIPYKINGCGWNGADCWGLVKIIAKEEFGIELPNQYSMKGWQVTSDDLDMTSPVSKVCNDWYEIIDEPRRNSFGLCNMCGLHAVWFIEPHLTIEMLEDVGAYVCRNNIHPRYIRYYGLKGA